jgi:hypothetical protein
VWEHLPKLENKFIPLIAKLKRYRSPDSDEIPAELIQAGGEILRSKIHKLINYIWNKEELPDRWKNFLINGSSLILYQFTNRVIKLTVVIIVGYHCYQLHTKLKVKSIYR